LAVLPVSDRTGHSRYQMSVSLRRFLLTTTKRYCTLIGRQLMVACYRSHREHKQFLSLLSRPSLSSISLLRQAIGADARLREVCSLPGSSNGSVVQLALLLISLALGQD